MIRRGYRLPFAQYPSQCFLKNDRSALQHPEFVAEATTELLSNGCIVEHVVPPFCMNPLTVAEGKKLRLLIDLRRVNNCLVKPRFKYEDLRSLSQVLDEEHWFFTWDLKSGYHHVDICLDHQKYLGFAWPFSGVVRYFTFAVLPFGLSSACFFSFSRRHRFQRHVGTRGYRPKFYVPRTESYLFLIAFLRCLIETQES